MTLSSTVHHGCPAARPELALQRPHQRASSTPEPQSCASSRTLTDSCSFLVSISQEYHDVNRTYNDVAQALSQYPSLSPRTDVHSTCLSIPGPREDTPQLMRTRAPAAFPNGSSALLLHLSGTIPAVFRGTTYRFPVSLWIPHAYPREPPLVYVTPTETMVVRPGQHVDPQGQVYHPYLVGWGDFWDVCWDVVLGVARAPWLTSGVTEIQCSRLPRHITGHIRKGTARHRERPGTAASCSASGYSPTACCASPSTRAICKVASYRAINTHT